MKSTLFFTKLILSGLFFISSVSAHAQESSEDLLKAFYPTLIPTAIHNGTTLDTLMQNTNCETLPETPFINDPDGNAVFAAQKAYCRLVENNISVSKDNAQLKTYLVAGQLQRIKHIIDLHSDGMYTSSSPNPSKSQWRQLISNELEPSSFGAVEVEIQKVIRARDELNSLGSKNMHILAYAGLL